MIKVVKEKVMEMIDDLVKRIDTQVSRIHKTKGDAEYQHQVIKEKQTRLKLVIGEVHRLFKSVEKSYQQLDSGILGTPEQMIRTS